MNKVFDRFVGLGFLVIGASVILQSHQLSQKATDSSVGPNVFPFGLGLILILLSLRQLYETFQYKQENKKKVSLDYKRFFIILVSAIFYAIFLENLGFIICTFIFLMIGFQTMEKGGVIKSFIISSTFSFGLYYIFVQVLEGTLPGFPSWLGL